MIAAAPRSKPLALRRLLSRVALCAFAAALLLVVLFPIYWMVVISLQERGKLFIYPPQLFPDTLRLTNYVDVFTQLGAPTWLRNSIVVSAAVIAISLPCSALAAYALARLRLRITNPVMALMLLTQMLPATVLIIPLYLMFDAWHMVDSLVGLTLLYAATTIPVVTLMLQAFFKDIPLEIEEAALVDGCSQLGTLGRVTLPLAVPGLISVTLYTFVLVWQEFVFAVSLISSSDNFVVSVALAMTRQQYEVAWNQLMGTALIASLPTLIIFLALQRWLVTGLAEGGVRG